MPNATHRKRLARAYAAQTGLPYMAALDAVTKAATEGRLPARLDDAGMQAALRILATGTSATPAVMSAAISAALDAATSGANPDRKVASDPRDQQVYDLSAVYEHLTGKQGLIYISSPGSGKDRYVFGGVGGGHVCLGRDDALAYVMNLVNEAAAQAAHEDAPQTSQSETTTSSVARDRYPYVGEGADGARRSAQIDREEADGLDRTDPRCADLLESAERWDTQAARLDAACEHRRTEYRSREGTYCADCGRLLTSHAAMVDADAFYLEKSYVRRLREVWQGRVTLTLTGPNRTRYTIDDNRASDLKDIELRWLASNGYIEATLAQGEEWAVARTTPFGEDVLAAQSADTERFRDGLPSGLPHRRITSEQIQQCPIKSLSASHYREDGTCGCTAEAVEPDRDLTFVSGPHTSAVYAGETTRQVRPFCDLCNRRLGPGEEWWLVHSTGRGWDNDAGIACKDHSPERLPRERAEPKRDPSW